MRTRPMPHAETLYNSQYNSQYSQYRSSPLRHLLLLAAVLKRASNTNVHKRTQTFTLNHSR